MLSGSTGIATAVSPSEGGAAETVQTPTIIPPGVDSVPDAGGPPGQAADGVVVLRQGGCDVGAGTVASGLPLLVVLPLWAARRRARRREER